MMATASAMSDKRTHIFQACAGRPELARLACPSRELRLRCSFSFAFSLALWTAVLSGQFGQFRFSSCRLKHTSTCFSMHANESRSQQARGLPDANRAARSHCAERSLDPPCPSPHLDCVSGAAPNAPAPTMLAASVSRLPCDRQSPAAPAASLSAALAAAAGRAVCAAAAAHGHGAQRPTLICILRSRC